MHEFGPKPNSCREPYSGCARPAATGIREDLPRPVRRNMAVRRDRCAWAGGFRTVHPGVGPDRKPVAVMILNLTHPGASPIERLLHEVEISERTAAGTYPHLLCVQDHLIEADAPFLVMNRAENSLRDALSGLSDEERSRAFRDITEGLVEPHGIPIVHRDLKPQNVLLHGGVWKLADFGIAGIWMNPRRP